jgi:hypothetical protein
MKRIKLKAELKLLEAEEKIEQMEQEKLAEQKLR